MSSQASYQVRILQENETIVLPESLARSAGFVGLDSWLNFVHRIYKFPLYRMITQLKSEIDGWLALVRVKHPIFGDYLTTSPFGSYGGDRRGCARGYGTWRCGRSHMETH